MEKVLYRWSEKGTPDLCSKEVIMVNYDCLCYHCGMSISAGSEVVSLLTERNEIYLLHKACSEMSCSKPGKGCRK